MSATMSGRQMEAAAFYAKACERAPVERRPQKAAIWRERLRKAREALTPTQRAIIDLSVKGLELSKIAFRTGRKREELVAEYLAACDALADHYDAQRRLEEQ